METGGGSTPQFEFSFVPWRTDVSAGSKRGWKIYTPSYIGCRTVAVGWRYFLLGRTLSGYSPKERSRAIGIVLTDKTQAGGLSVRELVALGRQPHTGFFGRLSREDNEKIDHALRAVGIADKASKYTAELSDGERQKVMIAKALVQECPLILLDEPTAFLDVVSRIEIMTLLHRLASEEQRAILMSTHDIEQALVLGDRLWLMKKGEGVTCGVTEDLILAHKMDHLFRTKTFASIRCMAFILLP